MNILSFLDPDIFDTNVLVHKDSGVLESLKEDGQGKKSSNLVFPFNHFRQKKFKRTIPKRISDEHSGTVYTIGDAIRFARIYHRVSIIYQTPSAAPID